MSNEERSRPMKRKLEYESADSTPSKRRRSDRKEPTCGRCKIHGVVAIKLKGHKHYCQFRACSCELCSIYLRRKRLSADQIALTRARKLSEEHKRLPDEVPSSILNIISHRKCGLHILVEHTWREMKDPLIVRYIHPKMLRIFDILVQYAYHLDEGITLDSLLKSAKDCISQVIHEDPMSFMMTFQQAACCYLAPPVVRPPEEAPIGIRSLQYPFQNFPKFWPTDSLSILATSASPFPENSIKPPTEPAIKPFTDRTTEPSTEPSVSSDSSTESSTYYW